MLSASWLPVSSSVLFSESSSLRLRDGEGVWFGFVPGVVHRWLGLKRLLLRLWFFLGGIGALAFSFGLVDLT